MGEGGVQGIPYSEAYVCLGSTPQSALLGQIWSRQHHQKAQEVMPGSYCQFRVGTETRYHLVVALNIKRKSQHLDGVEWRLSG